MKILNQSLTCILCFLFLSLSINAQHSISGNLSVCYGDCSTYNVDNGLGGPYLWLLSGEIQGSNQGESIEVCWDVIGENDIRVVDFSAAFADQSFEANVDVFEIPQPDILFPLYPTCVVRDSTGETGQDEFKSIECKTVCSSSIATYFAQYTSGNTVTWEVDGGTILSSSNEEITIQWNNAGSGYITITESGNGCTDTKSYCMSILEPLEVDIIVFNGGATDISVCLGSDIYLQGLGSSEVTNFQWSFSNGEIQSGESTSISFDSPGTYSVTLTGTTECGCSETTDYTIIVEQNPGPEITCTGTTCNNTEQTYYAANTCSVYTWSLSSNGSITDGGGSGDDFITVSWASGPVGTVSLSTSGCAEALCAQTTSVQIPILDSSTSIAGPVVVCKGGYSRYSIQYFNGTEYSWSLAGNGTIIDGHGTNEITVEWEETPWSDNQSTLTVAYDNCYLECGGTGTLTIDLLPEFELTIEDTYCQDQNAYIYAYSGWDSAIVDIEITTPSGTTLAYPGVSSISDPFSEIGEYTIRATDSQNNYCNDEVIFKFNIVSPPPTPTSIIGPKTICLNEYYNYSIPYSGPSINAYWIVRDGSTTSTFFAASISYQWTSNGPYSITIRNQDNDTGCRSDEYVQNLDKVQNSTISGSDVVCVDEVTTYTLSIAGGNDAIWNVSPAGAGTVVENYDNTIDVMWHTAGNHTISSDFCGASINFNVTANDLPNAAANFPDKVCSGEQATIDIIASSSTIILTDELENIVSNTFITLVDPGKYIATITNSFGCEEVIPIVIDTFLSPVVRVSSPQENVFCLPHAGVEIFALDTDDGYTYEWFHDDVSTGAVSSVISTSNFGEYHVIVTDQNGCTAKSNIHKLWEWCEGDQPPGTCSGGGGGGPISIDHNSLTCNNLEFNVTGAYSSTSFTWDFSDPDTAPDDIGYGLTTTHEFSSAGFYYVFLYGNIFSERTVEIITVPVAPRFDIDHACAGTDIQFNNHSTFIPGYYISQYRWDFGDPSSGLDNTSTSKDPTHNFTLPGFYTVTLEVTGDNGCISEYELLIEVEEGPYGEFVLPISTCSNEGLEFIALESPEIIKYEWDFADPSSGPANYSTATTAIHKFSSNGTFNVSLTVYDIDGCPTTITKPVDVTSTTLSGDITSDQTFPMCFGQAATLEAPLGGDAYYWSNGETTQTITTQESGTYAVTITEAGGCAYYPDPVNVIVEGIIDNRIRGIYYEEEFGAGIEYYDSMVVCESAIVTLRAQYFSSTNYNWSFPTNNSAYVPTNEFANLPPGRHTFHVDIESTVNSCIVQSQPFHIIIEPKPAAFTLDSPSGTLCEGESHILAVNSPDPNLRYFWNTGEEGISIDASQAGYYSATAININGCQKESSSVYINQRPNANKINLGCTSACFPDTICIPNIQGASTYTWMRDGVPISNGLYKDLVADEAGDYQLIVENYNGCPDTSDILTIDAEPSDQSIAGLVFIDSNNNGIWESGEELLAGVPVSIYDGNILISTINTDAAGYYLFDPITTVNPTVKIDTTGLGLDVNDGIFEGEAQFKTCIEDLLQDFPLIKNCAAVEANLEVFVCSDQTVTIDNIILTSGDNWDFEDSNINGCDSITHVLVSEYPQPNVILNTDPSCINTDAGVLNISIMSGTGLQFAIDNPVTFSSDLTFDNLPAGSHTLWLIDDNGCTNSYNFDIEILAAPEMAFITDNSCAGGSTGSAQITPVNGGNFEYSIDGINYSSSSSFPDLPEGSYTIFAQDLTTTCIHEHPISIVDNPVPQFDIAVSNSCAIGNTGTAGITPVINGNYEYSIDGINYVSDTDFFDLESGDYTLSILENSSCVHSITFTIGENISPIINLTPFSTCAGTNEGSVLVSALSSGNYEYSIDGVNYSDAQSFSSLAIGQYTVFVLEDGMCLFQYPVDIQPEPEPFVTFTSEDACVGVPNGQISISTTESGLKYSLDQISFSSDSIIQNLDAGIYTVYVQGENDCVHPFDVEIFESPELEIEYVDPELDCSIDQVELNPIIINAVGDISYLWNDGSVDSSFIASRSDKYSVEITDKCSTSTYEWDIQLENIVEKQPIFFPNIFSPNQDGVNECFQPTIRPETTILSYRLIIFDRWGNKYFETTKLDDCWDGTLHDKDVRAGVFVYLLELEYTYCVEVDKIKKYGDVTIVH